MKLRKMLLAALCLLLVACVAAPAMLAEDNAALTANMTDITLVKGESVVVELTYEYTGKVLVGWDNANAINCKMSGAWDGNRTSMTVTGVGVGKSTITLTDSVTNSTLKIKVTVTDGKQAKSELRTLAGKTVKAANKLLPNGLKAVKSGYDNGRFSVKLDAFKRIKNITLYGGKGAYRLFSVYPGMKYATAVSKLKKQGWKQAKKTSKAVILLSNSDLFHAVKLVRSAGKVGKIIYYIP